MEPSPSSRRSYHQMQTAMRVSKYSFSRMCCTCFCTVRELHPRIFPISAFRFPAAIHSTTSSSRLVKGRDSAPAGRFDVYLVGGPPGRPFRVGMGVAFNNLPDESRPYALGRMPFQIFPAQICEIACMCGRSYLGRAMSALTITASSVICALRARLGAFLRRLFVSLPARLSPPPRASSPIPATLCRS